MLFFPRNVPSFECRELHQAFHFILEMDIDIWGNPRVPIVPKFMQTLSDSVYEELEKIAVKRGITMQELIRAVIIPEWVRKQEGRRKGRQT